MSDSEKQLFEQVESIDDNILQDIPEEQRKPVIGDVNWTDYVLSLLEDKEFVLVGNKRIPKTDGLRRISAKYFGKVIESSSSLANAIYTDNGLISIVIHKLVIEKYGDEGYVTVVGLGDAREQFLSSPFNQYVSANASTKAMGRAYRDLLQLQVLVAEELNSINDLKISDDPEDLLPINDTQKAGIRSTCKRLGIDLNKFINYGPFKFNSLDKVLTGTGVQMMATLNGYQNGKEIPEDIQA